MNLIVIARTSNKKLPKHLIFNYLQQVFEDQIKLLKIFNNLYAKGAKSNNSSTF
jgi:hypothetical protein